MPVITASHQGLGRLNNTMPIWDMGCLAYWNPRYGADVVQERGGSQAAATGLTYTYAGLDNYCVFDPGTGYYQEVTAAAKPIPTDGHFQPARDNYFYQWDPSVDWKRGIGTAVGTIDPALTQTQVVVADSLHIIRKTAGFPADLPRLTNTSGADRRAGSLKSLSVTFNRVFSVLVRRVDGAPVTAADVELGINIGVTPLTDPNIAAMATVYKPVGNNGWYMLYTYIAAVAGPPTYFVYLNVKNGASVYYEAPQWESQSASIMEPTARIVVSGLVSKGRDVFCLSAFNSRGFGLPKCGWMAVCWTPRDNAGLGAPRAYPASVFMRWSKDADPGDNYHQLGVSSTAQAVVFTTYANATTSEIFIQTLTAEVLQGQAMGVVASWGYRGTTPQAMGALNGKMTELETTFNLPTGDATLFIGSSTAAGASPANGHLWAAAIGNKMLSRYDIRLLSRWFQKQAHFPLGT